MSARHLTIILGLGALSLPGCLSPVQRDVDALVCHRAAVVADLPPPEFIPPAKETKPRPPIDPKKPPSMLERLEVPPGVPGSDAPKIVWPKDFGKLSDKEKDAYLAKYFQSQIEVGPDPRPVPGPDGRRLILSDFQRLAREHSPLIRQAAFAIKAAEGAAIQAGVYPNPTFGVSGNAISFTSGSTFGVNFSQTIKTMGKLKLSQAMATMDLANSQLAYRRAETDLMASVRSAYFAVLASQEGMKANRALMELTDQVYKVMLLQLKGGQVAPYEPAQVGVFAGQARIAYLQSRNNYQLAWKNLATAIGLPLMPATEVAGSLSKNLPHFDYEKALAHVLTNHTDALTAQYGLEKARYNLRLAQVTPVPDITLGAGLVYDASPPGPPALVPVLTGSVTLPIFDRNQGGIRQAQAALGQAAEEPHRVQNALTASFSDAYRRLEENRLILDLYRRQLLPQQVQAFRAAVLRHYSEAPQLVLPGAATAFLTDLISAEQNVVSLIASYLTTLQAYWQAASDVASWLQTDDVYEMSSEVTNLPDTDLTQLLNLPCCHPCSSVPGAPGAHAPPHGPPAPPGHLPASLGTPTPISIREAFEGGRP
jgi:cobalt-zinc-cadmium efflux system outer membrane protein